VERRIFLSSMAESEDLNDTNSPVSIVQLCFLLFVILVFFHCRKDSSRLMKEMSAHSFSFISFQHNIAKCQIQETTFPLPLLGKFLEDLIFSPTKCTWWEKHDYPERDTKQIMNGLWSAYNSHLHMKKGGTLLVGGVTELSILRKY
jgi:hypothetical protein